MQFLAKFNRKGVTYIWEGAVLDAELRLNVLLEGCARVDDLCKSYKLALISSVWTISR